MNFNMNTVSLNQIMAEHIRLSNAVIATQHQRVLDGVVSELGRELDESELKFTRELASITAPTLKVEKLGHMNFKTWGNNPKFLAMVLCRRTEISDTETFDDALVYRINEERLEEFMTGVIEPVMSFGRLSWAVAIDQQFMAD